jgi:hypothetical protein
LHTLYGYKTYTGFKSGDDIELDTGRRDLTGHTELPANLLEALQSNSADVFEELSYLHESPEIYFIKSHATIDELNNSSYPTVLIVRDPRDTFLSFSHYIVHTQRTWKRLKMEIAATIFRPESITAYVKLVKNACKTAIVFSFKLLGAEKVIRQGLLLGIAKSTRWSELCSGWMERPAGKTVVVRFEELTNEPAATVAKALLELNIVVCPYLRNVPSFSELQQVHPRFFRQGKSGAWRETMPHSISTLIKAKHKQMLEKLNYAE